MREGQKRRTRAERRRQQAGPINPAQLDTPALDRLCRLRALVRMDGELLPLVQPHGHLSDHMVFDAGIAAAGLTAFVRPRVASDQPGAGARLTFAGSYILVRQLAPGVRTRVSVDLSWPAERN